MDTVEKGNGDVMTVYHLKNLLMSQMYKYSHRDEHKNNRTDNQNTGKSPSRKLHASPCRQFRNPKF